MSSFVRFGRVVVGFKAKYSATFLVLLLSVSNILINNWWSVHPNHPQKDYLRFDFFRTCPPPHLLFFWRDCQVLTLVFHYRLGKNRDAQHRRRTAVARQHGSRRDLDGRKEEGLLDVARLLFVGLSLTCPLGLVGGGVRERCRRKKKRERRGEESNKRNERKNTIKSIMYFPRLENQCIPNFLSFYPFGGKRGWKGSVRAAVS